jgi:hypothetical protein
MTGVATSAAASTPTSPRPTIPSRPCGTRSTRATTGTTKARSRGRVQPVSGSAREIGWPEIGGDAGDDGQGQALGDEQQACEQGKRAVTTAVLRDQQQAGAEESPVVRRMTRAPRARD